MKVCFDTSVVIDILGKTSWFPEAFAVYDVCMVRRFDVLLSVSSTTDIVYVLHSGGLRGKSHARQSVADVLSLFDLVENLPVDCMAAYESDMPDYEDALIAYSSARAGADVIVTRNKKDFLHAPISAMTPKEFLAAYQPSDTSYEDVAF